MGYIGGNCDIDIDECFLNLCRYGVICFDIVGNYSCSCVLGFIGINCEVDVDECVLNLCLNNVFCVDLIDGYSC